MYKHPSHSTAASAAIKSTCGASLKLVLRKYDDPASVSKLAAAQMEIDKTQDIMQENILAMQENLIKVERVDDKSEKFKDTAEKFADNAHELERIMYWRNMKMNIIIGTIATVVIGYFILPFI